MKLVLVALLICSAFFLLTACSASQDGPSNRNSNAQESSSSEYTTGISIATTTDAKIVSSRQDRNVPNLQRFLDEEGEEYYVVSDSSGKEFFQSDRYWRGYDATYCSDGVFYVQLNLGGSAWGYRFFDVNQRLVSEHFVQDYESLAAGYGLVAYIDNWEIIVQDIFEPEKFKKRYARDIHGTVMAAISKPVFIDKNHLLLEYEVEPQNGETYPIFAQEVVDLTKPVNTPPIYEESCVPMSVRTGNIQMLSTNYIIYREDGQSDRIKIFNYAGEEIYSSCDNIWSVDHVTPDVLSVNEEEYINLKTGEVTTERPKPVW